MREINSLVSIIVPVWNAEEYLPICIDSILAQSYKNIELLLIDDGSTDSSAVICDKYGENDKRVRVIHQQNGGVSAARNTGLSHAQGKWVSFVDNDDVIPTYAIEHLVTNAEINGADIAQGLTQEVVSYQEIHLDNSPDNNLQAMIYTPEQFLWSSHVKKDRYLAGCIWGKLFRADIVKKYQYPIGKYGEDTQFCALAFSDRLCKRVLYLEEIVYFHLLLGTSASHKWSAEKWMEIIGFLGNNYSLILSKGNDTGVASWYLYDFYRMLCGHKNNLAEERVLTKSLNDSFQELRAQHLPELLNSKLKLHKKMACYIISGNSRLYPLARHIYRRLKKV